MAYAIFKLSNGDLDKREQYSEVSDNESALISREEVLNIKAIMAGNRDRYFTMQIDDESSEVE